MLFTVSVPVPLAVSTFTPLTAPPSVAAPLLYNTRAWPLPFTVFEKVSAVPNSAVPVAASGLL